ncbi:major facilitator superfamily domain-containing protein [Cladochytrium replicatum]|nr:major facilitator superfamily domain-containing protein [Cladochytrium replicatum]
MAQTQVKGNSNWRSSTWLCLVVVWLGIFVDICTYSIVIPILPIVVVEQGGDAWNVGLLLGAYGIGVLIAAPTFGILSDKFKKRKLFMVLGLIGLLLSTVFFALGRALGFVAFFIARFFQGASSAIVWTLGLALVSDHFRTAQGIGAAMGIVLSGFTVGQVAGAPIGGALYSQLGFYAPFIFCAVLVVIDLIGRLLIIEPAIEEAPTEIDIEESTVDAVASETADRHDDTNEDTNTPLASSATLENIKPKNSEQSGVRSFFSLLLNRHLLVLCYMTILFSACLTAIEPTLPLLLEKNYGMDALGVGLVFLAAVIPSAIAGPLAGWLWDLCKLKNLNGSHYVLLPAAIAGTVVSLSFCLILPPEGWSLPSPAPLAGLIVAVFLFGTICAFTMTPMFPEVSATVPNGSVAQSYALYSVGFSLSLLVGPLLGSAIYGAFGWGWASVCIAVMFLLCIPATIWYRSPDLK